MDAHLFRLFCNAALPFIKGARIEKIQEPAADLLCLVLFNQGRKQQLIFQFERKNPFCFFSNAKLSAGCAPSAQIMRIRRYFAQRRIAAAVCQFCSRRLWLMPTLSPQESGQKIPWLCLDLKTGPQLYFFEPMQIPEENAPNWPQATELRQAIADWRSWPVLTPALRKTLLLLEPQDQLALMEDLKCGNGYVFLYAAENAGHRQIRQALAWPLPKALAAGLNEIVAEDVLAAIGEAGRDFVLIRLAQNNEAAMHKPLQARLRQIGKILARLDSDAARFESILARESEALLLQANLWRWPADYRAPEVEIDGRKVALDERFSLRENMERLFHSLARAKRGLKSISQRRHEPLAERDSIDKAAVPGNVAAATDEANGQTENDTAESRNAVNSTAAALQKIVPKNIQVYAGRDGYVYLRGKDAKGNHALRKFASPHHLWVHAAGGPGAHLIIRLPYPGHVLPETTLEEAGVLAAQKSWLAGAARAEVIFAELRHVKPIRGGQPGAMTVDKVFMTKIVRLDTEQSDGD